MLALAFKDLRRRVGNSGWIVKLVIPRCLAKREEARATTGSRLKVHGLTLFGSRAAISFSLLI